MAVTTQGCLQLLISLLCLTITLGIKTRRETHSDPENIIENHPYLGNKLGSTVRHCVLGDNM